MKPFLAIDCGAASLKVALFEPRPNGVLVLARYEIASLGQRGLEEVERTGLLKEVLRDVFDRNEIRAKGLDANICTPSYQSFTKFLSTPALDGSKVGKIIEYEAQQNVPFPLDEVAWGYQIMGEAEDGELDVLLMALKLDVIDSLSTVCTDLGLKLSIVDGAPAALRNAFMHNYGELEGCSMLVDIGAKTTNVIFVEGGNFFVRSINFGANSITQEFARESGLDWQQAEEYKQQYGYVHLTNTEEPADPYQAIAVRTTRQVMTRLHQQIDQTKQYYVTQRKGQQPVRLFLAGMGSSMTYTAEFFMEKFNLPVEFFNPFRNIELGPEVDRNALVRVAHAMGELAGLGLRTTSVGLTDFNLLPRREKISRQIEKRSPYVVATLFCVGLIFFVYGAQYKSVTGKQEQAVKDLEAKLAEHSQTANSMVKAKNDLDSSKQETEKVERLLRTRYIWINITRAVQDVLAEITPEIYILSGPDQLELMDKTLDEILTEFQPRSVTNAVTAVWLESLTTNVPGEAAVDVLNASGSGGEEGEEGEMAPGMSGSSSEYIFLTLTAKNILPRERETLNSQFALLLAKRFRASPVFEDSEEATKVIGSVPPGASTDRWFKLKLQLKLVHPIQMEDMGGSP
jgi:type IV pilus assembly protein PilM